MIDTIRQFGKYQIIEELGHAGFGTVFKALDTTLAREVALKVLDPLLARDPSFIQRFRQEAQVTAGFFHPNIAVVFEVGEAEGRQFIAMQYVPGRNLRDILDAEGPLPFDRIVAIVRQIGAALDHAHAHGAIHRDVKPSNILVDADGHATLTDFGIAKALEGTLVHTTSRAVMGTPYYASPEQAESQPQDGRSDLYSLGIVAYELCTQRVPFSADTTPSLLYRIVHEDPLPPSQANARVAGPIEEVLLKAIARQPEQRYQAGAEFADVLEAAVQGMRDASNIPSPTTLSQQASATSLEEATRSAESERQLHESSRVPVSSADTASRGGRVRVARSIVALVGLLGLATIAITIIWLLSQPTPLRSQPATAVPPTVIPLGPRVVTGMVYCGIAPASGTRVVLGAPNGDPDAALAEAVTGPDGWFVLERPPTGTFRIAARPSTPNASIGEMPGAALLLSMLNRGPTSVSCA